MSDSRTLRVVITGNASSAEEAIEGLAETSQDAGNELDAMGGKMGRFRGAMAGMGAAVLAALPLAALVAFSKGLDEIHNRAKLAASMGLTGKDAEQAGKLAGQLYVSGFGESTAETGEIVRRVSQDLNMGVHAVDFKPVASKVAAISEVMNQEIGGTTKAVANLMRNGLAKNADEALDVVAAGFVNGVDKSQDFLDTLNEYTAPFKRLGLDGPKAVGLLSQGLKAGARDADFVADALKEFSIRAIDASTTSATAYEELGLNAEEMTAKIARGGAEAEQGLSLVLERLRGTEDPVKRNAAAVGLFGTKAEDLADSLFALNPQTAVQSLGKVKGAAQQMADTMHHNAAAKVEGFKRKLEMGFTNAAASAITSFESVGHKLAPAFQAIGQVLSPFVQGLQLVGQKIRASFDTGAARVALGQLTAKLSGIWAAVGPALQQFVLFFRTTLMPVFQELWLKAQPVLVQLWQTFMTYLDFIKTSIQVFVTTVQVLWSVFGGTILQYVRTAWSAVWQVISGVLSVIQGIYNVFIGIFTGNWSRAWQGVKQIFSGVWEVIVGVCRAVTNTIKTVLRLALDAVKALWSAAWNGIKSVFSSIWSGITGYFSNALGNLRANASSGVSAVKSFFVNGFQSLYAAVRDKVSSVVGVVREIPGKVSGALSGLGSTLTGIGRNIIQGLVNGIRGSLGAVMSAARAIVDQIPGPIRKALGIHSPSRVLAEIGKWIPAGLVKGMLGGSKKVAETSKKLHELVTKAFKGKEMTRGAATILHNYISRQNKRLMALAKTREKIQERLTAANDKLAGLKKAKAEMASSIADKANNFGSFMGVLDTAQYGDNSANALLARLKGKLRVIANFRKNLQTLAKRGLGPGIISEIAQAGPEEGGQMAHALLNAGGGQIKELNSTYSAIGNQSKALGKFVSGNYYDAGIAAATGVVKGLKAQEKNVTKAIQDMAKAMSDELNRCLKLIASGNYFTFMGRIIRLGYGRGKPWDGPDFRWNRKPGMRPPGGLANRSISHARPTRAAPTVHVTVQGNVTAEKALARSIATTIRDEIVRSGKRNGGRTGL
ncbi:phage tail tape measure protein [Streptomyces antimicrobicus]|uniref:Phage tail tape measure protein n=1 Tax=Streptomyces antimicrobicus TaxID=2883108 RepID=A0ABS8B4H0_9ACTN|nr:phage tail tape measure protein [Streptomyces antimicrobicus]MCB5179509.1 phage tail tape measure protein [Streptomyces antimicrobicus]